MKELTALPKWWGIFMTALAGLFSFPALGQLLEGHQSELWEVKVRTMGEIYSNGMLIWAFVAFGVCGVFLMIGYQIIRTSDPKAE